MTKINGIQQRQEAQSSIVTTFQLPIHLHITWIVVVNQSIKDTYTPMEPRKCFYSIFFLTKRGGRKCGFLHTKLILWAIFSSLGRRKQNAAQQKFGERTNYGLPNFANFIGIIANCVDFCGNMEAHWYNFGN